MSKIPAPPYLEPPRETFIVTSVNLLLVVFQTSVLLGCELGCEAGNMSDEASDHETQRSLYINIPYFSAIKGVMRFALLTPEPARSGSAPQAEIGIMEV